MTSPAESLGVIIEAHRVRGSSAPCILPEADTQKPAKAGFWHIGNGSSYPAIAGPKAGDSSHRRRESHMLIGPLRRGPRGPPRYRHTWVPTLPGGISARLSPLRSYANAAMIAWKVLSIYLPYRRHAFRHRKIDDSHARVTLLLRQTLGSIYSAAYTVGQAAPNLASVRFR